MEADNGVDLIQQLKTKGIPDIILLDINNKEIDFLKLACSEMTYKEIAEKMCLGVHTIDGYRDALFEKLEVKSRIGLVLYAIKNKIVLIE